MDLSKIKVQDCNYYGFDHELVAKNFEGELTYVGTVSIEGRARAVYHNAKPNLEKNHKEFMLLYSAVAVGLDGAISNFYVSGMDRERILGYLVVPLAWCTNCNEGVYSCDRHHSPSCSCDSVFIDGGDCYTRHNQSKHLLLVNYNVLTKEVLIPEAENDKSP